MSRRLAVALLAFVAACKGKPADPPPAPPAVDLAAFARPAAPPPAGPVDAAVGPDLLLTHRCPPEMVPIATGGCIDKYEASGQGALGTPDGKGTKLVAESVAGRMPLTKVSMLQATKACENAKKHLCSEDEWVAGCKGPFLGNRSVTISYGYGVQFLEGRCNDWHASDQGKKGPVPTGAFSRCVTYSGIYDMSGNVAEVVSTREKNVDRYAARGGYFRLSLGDSSCEADDFTVGPTDALDSIGFRCCREALGAEKK